MSQTRATRREIRELGAAFDLLAAYEPGGFFAERAGLGVATSALAGVPFTLAEGGYPSLPDLFTAREREEAVDTAASGVAAVGYIPFDPREAGVIGIPSRVVRRDRAGQTVAIGSADGGAPPRSPAQRGIAHAPFGAPQLRAEPDRGAYADAVREAVRRIRGGELTKVVLARTLAVAADRRLEPAQLLRRLRAVEPDCTAFAVPTGPGTVLVGASPELLVARRGPIVTANPLAGSAPRWGDPVKDAASARALLASAKDRDEHRIVVEAIIRGLEPWCDELTWDEEPVLRETANVWHLSTRFEGVLSEPWPVVLDLVGALHPTPAVAGEPREDALALIDRLEPVRRGAYAGSFGWMDARGDGSWAIALRCAELDGASARLFAGAGIVSDSQADREVEETERKFLAFLDALRWG